MKVKPMTISAYAIEMQKMTLSPDRAAELASEAGAINEAVLAAATKSFGFFDEPAHFLGVLEAEAESFE